jgi:hypothetical protein
MNKFKIARMLGVATATGSDAGVGDNNHNTACLAVCQTVCMLRLTAFNLVRLILVGERLNSVANAYSPTLHPIASSGRLVRLWRAVWFELMQPTFT